MVVEVKYLAAAVILLMLSGCIGIPPEGTPAPTPTPAIAAPSPTAASTITPAIRVTSYPARVDGEENFTIKWEVTGGILGEISHSAVHWGFKTGRADITDYGRFSRVETGKTPQEFTTVLKAPSSGPIYLRAHAIVDGADLYSDEYVIAINIE